ncbi:sigma factor-like helix-turn-helix DNA-binding protein [Nocardia sp. NPDC052316]|uniref:sigma factor-like helix-turn-helix DNA-binding protein n=1 Tax=Nocardia sp. NPDC052316 TaxID=3364329 RepID=UPI0037C68BFE
MSRSNVAWNNKPSSPGLNSLTPAQREAISLAYYGGRTYLEVAHYLGIGLPTVKARIRDGLHRLKRRIR